MANRLRLDATIARKEPLRLTPAGAAVLAFSVTHQSSQMEAGSARDVSFEAQCVAIGEVARRLEPLATGTRIEIEGFLAARSRQSRSLVLHVNEFSLIRG